MRSLTFIASFLICTVIGAESYASESRGIKYKYYTVQQDDTLTCAATRVYGRATFYPELASQNLNIKDVNHLKPGQKLRYIPGREKKEFYDCSHKNKKKTSTKATQKEKFSYYKIKKGDTLYKIGKKLFGRGSLYRKRILKYNTHLIKNKILKVGSLIRYKTMRKPASEIGFGSEYSSIEPRTKNGKKDSGKDNGKDNGDDADDLDFNLIAYVGAGLLNYNQTLVDPSSEKTLNARLYFQYRFRNTEWHSAFNGVYHFYNLSAAGTNTPFQLLEGNLSFGHSLIASYPWRVILFLGGFGSMMFPTVGGIEYYKYLVGPQIYTQIQRQWSGGNSINFYFKYAPVSNLASDPAWGNRNFTAGLSWIHDFKSGGAFSILAEYSNTLFSDTARQNALGDTHIDMTAATLSLGFGF